MKEIFETYTIKWKFLNRLCGSVPMSRELVRPWLEARMGEVPEEVEREVLETIDDAQEKVTLGFQHDGTGLFIRGGTVKAHIKDCANQLRETLGIKNLRSKVANRVNIVDYRIHLKRNGKHLQEPDATYDQPIHVMTPRGPRDSLKTIGYLNEPELVFTVKLLKDNEVDRDVLEAVFNYGSIHGYGGERSMGEGRYNYQILDGSELEE